MKPVPTVRYERELTALIKSRRLTGKRIRKVLTTIIEHPNHPSLKLHKLSGTNNYAASVDRNIRMILHFENDIVVLLRIGTHDEVY